MRAVVVLVFLIFSEFSVAGKDLFLPKEKYLILNPLSLQQPSNLIFKGAVLANYQLAFVGDVQGHVYQVTLAQEVGVTRARVIKIMRDKVVLSDGQRYYIIY